MLKASSPRESKGSDVVKVVQNPLRATKKPRTPPLGRDERDRDKDRVLSNMV
jgi:hypothetical protein